MQHTTRLYKNIQLIFIPLIGTLVFSSCTLFTVVRNEPQNRPYIFQTQINIKDKKLKNDEKSRLEAGLYEQLDDSIAARKLDKVFWEVLKNPQPMDTGSIKKSAEYMKNYLLAEGYFHDSISYTTSIKNVGNHQRSYINFNVWPGKPTRIDSFTYSMQNARLQFLADSSKKDALIGKGIFFGQQPVSLELDRLVELYKNNGYLRFTRNNLYVLWDTLDIDLLQPAFDPLDQVGQLKKLKERQENPTVNLEIRQKQNVDSSSLKKFYVGNVTVYPDDRKIPDPKEEKRTTMRNVTVIQQARKFNTKIFPQYVYLKQGERYSQARYIRTVNHLNGLGTWRLVDVDTSINSGSDTVNFVIRLTPAPKYNFTTNLESSFSQSILSGNFAGLGLNVGFQNRNFLRSANLATTNFRYGVELGGFTSGSFIQTQQMSISNSIILPRFVFPGMRHFKNTFRGNVQSILTLNVANTDRRSLFSLKSFSTSWGYDFTQHAKSHALNKRMFSLGVKLPNIEYSLIKRTDNLLKLIESNPSIQNLFSDGLITSVIANFSMPWNSPNKRQINLFKLNTEISGLLTGVIKNKFIDDQLYRFVKFDVEYAKLFKLTGKTSLVLRGFGGLGYELDATANSNKRAQLPFFKQYFAGGPNSMRAWQLRRLGPGSTIKYFDNDPGIQGEAVVPDRFGDVQLEANIEYRLPLFSIAGIPINGAIFTDVGNVWFLKKVAGQPDERFKLSRLGKDIAMGLGLGIRADFSFFVIRLDYAYKIKDPSPDGRNARYQNRFFAYPLFKGSQLQIDIGYPFIF